MIRIGMQWRLAIFGTTIALVAVAALAWSSRRTITLEFQRLTRAEADARLQALKTDLDPIAGADGVQGRLERVGGGRSFVVLDAANRCVAATPRDLCTATFSRTPTGGLQIAHEKGTLLRLFVGLPEVRLLSGATLLELPARLAGTGAAGFLDATGRAIWLAALATIGVSVLLSLWWARRMLGPVRALTAVAKKMEGGDLGPRVTVRSNDEIGDLARAFNAMADSLARQEGLRQDLMNDVAHELRTPLTSIRCHLEALQDGLVPAGPDVINSMHEEVMLLARIIDDLRDLSLAEAGHLRLRLEPLDLGEEVARAARASQPLAQARSVRVNVVGAHEIPPVLADQARFAQVLNNLLGNALRVAPPGSTVTVGLAAERTTVSIWVEDEGPGIAAQHLPHLFDRFYRAESSRSRETGGVGLGLAIVRQLVTAHGGDIDVQSDVGRGSRFTVRLPRDGSGSRHAPQASG